MQHLTRNLLAFGCSLSAKSCSLDSIVCLGAGHGQLRKFLQICMSWCQRTLIYLPNLGLSYISSRIIPKLCTPHDYFLPGDSRCPRNLSLLRCSSVRSVAELNAFIFRSDAARQFFFVISSSHNPSSSPHSCHPENSLNPHHHDVSARSYLIS
jgi:hypothetical protein